MKYIKTFETNIKHSSDFAMNHPLRNFSRKIEDILEEITKFESEQSKVRRYFEDNGNIRIVYSTQYGGKRLKINIYKDSVIEIGIIKYREWEKRRIDMTPTEEFFHFIMNNFKNYIVNLDTKKFEFSFVNLEFPLNEQDKVLKKFQEYLTYLDAKRYNL
jgi:hypothetical protein